MTGYEKELEQRLVNRMNKIEKSSEPDFYSKNYPLDKKEALDVIRKGNEMGIISDDILEAAIEKVGE